MVELTITGILQILDDNFSQLEQIDQRTIRQLKDRYQRLSKALSNSTNLDTFEYLIEQQDHITEELLSIV